MWQSYLKGFHAWLLLERSLSGNTIEAYLHDVGRMVQYLELKNVGKEISSLPGPASLDLIFFQDFLKWLGELGLNVRSQARMISGIKTFYKYLLTEDLIQENPVELLEAPRLNQHLPDVLTFDEIQQILSAIDLSEPNGLRNRAMLETLYACGLRVSELVNLKVSNLFADIGFVRVIGKNDKERIVPIGAEALKHIGIYMELVRRHQKIKKEHEDILFLNRRGQKLTRVMVFLIIKELVQKTGIRKNIGPHTFRHSFATHLIEGGADLKAIQDMLGHESITTTEIYTHLDTDYLRDTVLNFHPRNVEMRRKRKMLESQGKW